MATKVDRMQPNRLRHLKRTIEEGTPLSEGETRTLIALLDQKLEERSPDNMLAEFHKWIRQGDTVLSNLEQELTQLRELTAGGGDTISKSAMLAILNKYYQHNPQNAGDEGVNWVIEKISQEIQNLHSM